MSWFGLSRWNIERAVRPWGERPSILRFLEEKSVGAAQGDDLDLPDEGQMAGKGGIRWAAGAMDGVGSHHIGRRKDEDGARKVWSAIVDVVASADSASIGQLHELACSEGMLSIADQLAKLVRENKDVDRTRLRRVARWLVREAADREPVKLGVLLVGECGGVEDRPALERLARHDEFTVFAVVALGKLGLLDELRVWEIAKDVHGWGRIHLVERMGDSRDPRIRRWLVREGFRNSVMDEYLACICAETGDLAGELAEEKVDAELLDGAAGLLRALADTTWGGPASGFEAYDRGAEAALAFLRHAARRAGSLDQLLAADRLRRFVDDPEADWSRLASVGWNDERRTELAAVAQEVLRLPEWEGLVRAGIAADAADAFGRAAEAAELLGIDVWEAQFSRLERTRDHADWFRACVTKVPERMDRVVSFAERVLPLAEIASGPASESGMGAAWNNHRHLGLVLQELHRFPARGWRLISIGLRSPLTWDRNMALRALSGWDRATWPSDARPLLEAAVREEPEERTRENMRRLLLGEPLA